MHRFKQERLFLWRFFMQRLLQDLLILLLKQRLTHFCLSALVKQEDSEDSLEDLDSPFFFHVHPLTLYILLVQVLTQLWVSSSFTSLQD
jgi:hypothetical protein